MIPETRKYIWLTSTSDKYNIIIIQDIFLELNEQVFVMNLK